MNPRIAAGAASALLVFALAGGSDLEARRGKKEEPSPDKPALRLLVTPRHGFRPLTILLTGELTGVELDDPQFCHAGIEWESRSPLGLDVRSIEDPRCLHPPEQVNVDLTFTKMVTLHRVGLHQYRLILHKRDGERLLSNTQEVRVLDNQ
jgi:hypothetical protein